MRVKMLTIAAGPDLNLDADKVYDLPDAQAKVFVENGCAVPVDDKGQPLKPKPAK